MATTSESQSPDDQSFPAKTTKIGQNIQVHVVVEGGEKVPLGLDAAEVDMGQSAVEHPEANIQENTTGHISDLLDGALSKQNEKGVANRRKRFNLPSSN